MRTNKTVAELQDSSCIVGDWACCESALPRTDTYSCADSSTPRRCERSVGPGWPISKMQDGWSPGPIPFSPPRSDRYAWFRMRDAFGQPGYRDIIADPGFNRIPFTAPLADLMTQILGPEGFCYPVKLPRVVYPASMVASNPVTTSTRTTARCRTCSPAGCRSATFRGRSAASPSNQGANIAPSSGSGLSTGCPTDGGLPTDRAGDVLVFHCLTTHAALANREQRIRFSAEYRWQLADQPAPKRLVIGPRGHEIGSRLFAHTDWWHPVPRGLTLIHDGGPQRPTLPASPSRFVRLDDPG